MNNQKILVVDDEISIRKVYSEAFGRAGYTVQTAESAETALTFLEEENFDVTFIDLNLPAMNGLDLCRRIRTDRPMGIIIAVIGHGSLAEMVQCREAGFDDCFIKPVSMKTLIAVAKSAFEKINRWHNNEQCYDMPVGHA